MLKELEDRVAVVTGAASGIGAALCLGLAERGMRIVAADIDAGGAAVEALSAMIKTGIPPQDVVEPVVDGVRNGTFLIATRPSYRAQLRNRFEALLERRLPGPTPVD